MARPGYYAEQMARLRALAGNLCVWCGCPGLPGDTLEFAHLPGKETGLADQGRGQPQRYYDVRRNPGSYVLLCREHHTEMDGRGGKGTAEYGRFTRQAEAVA